MIDGLIYNDKRITWNYEKKIELFFEDIVFAYKDEYNGYIVVELRKNSDKEKKLYYDYDGNLIMESNVKEKYIWWKYNNDEKKIRIENLTSTLFSVKRKIIIVRYEFAKKDKAFALNFNGDFLYDINPPEGFKVWYFSENKDGIRVACINIVIPATTPGRHDYWFKINLSNGRLTKDGIAV